ncbi:hypothetical protein ALQ64_04026 [Pseudomonas cannabina]|uniref:Uncharacterized protein n=2 Tax=Pseudomonas cannabina TaxID=86840 RepID=A0A3M3LY74_PSECA|nr:hypothetical protein F4W70_27190 [Pseudomonas cannabina]RMN40051.1 hypothetical protein ALQ64_04026 [Pseudomonas cannabina]
MDQDRVHRDTLYAEVWSTPMVSLASKYGVSAVFLSRVCARLNVPCPPRGYWARKKSGQKPNIPPLPRSRTGDTTEWRKGDQLPRSQEGVSADAALKDRSDSRVMLMGSLDSFTDGRVAGHGYLKPKKRNLPDLVVTEPTLRRAAMILQKIANRFRDYQHRVSVACVQVGYARKALGEEEGRLIRSVFETSNWAPARPTLVFIGELAIGLTIYEQTADKEVVYIDGKYLPVSEARKLKPGLWSGTRAARYRVITDRAPTKRLCLRAYSPYALVDWTQTWTEQNASLSKQIDEIIHSLISSATSLGPKLAEAHREADLERKRWEEERRVARLKNQRSLVIKTRKDALHELLRRR